MGQAAREVNVSDLYGECMKQRYPILPDGLHPGLAESSIRNPSHSPKGGAIGRVWTRGGRDAGGYAVLVHALHRGASMGRHAGQE